MTSCRRSIERDYLDHFFAKPEGEQEVGADASVSYLYTPEAVRAGAEALAELARFSSAYAIR